MKIAICDDEKELLDTLNRLIKLEFNKLKRQVEIDCYETGEDLLETNSINEYDVVFLDVYLPGLSGFDVAEKINKKKNNTYIIFITSNAELVYDCFDYEPFYIIPKDAYNIGLPKAIKKLVKVRKQYEILEVQNNGKKYKLLMRDIIYLQSGDHAILIHTVKYDYTMRGNLIDLETKLDSFNFIRVHRKYIINLSYLSRIDTLLDEVILSNGKVLEMSRYYKGKVKEAQIQYLRSMK